MKRYMSKKTTIKAAKSSPSLHSTFDGLDDRFSFDLDDEFEIYLDTTTAEIKCFTVDSKVFGNGAGLTYDVVVAVPNEDAHWQITQDIERNLDRYIQEQTDGSDYTGWVEEPMWEVDTYSIPDEISDTCRLYTYAICVIPHQNIGPYGEYGIDAGIEDYEE